MVEGQGNGSCAVSSLTQGDHEHRDVTYLGSFVLVALAYGLVASIVKKKFHHSAFVSVLPHSLIVFMGGMGFGALDTLLVGESDHKYLGILSDSANNWKTLNAELILFIFLPPLLFVSALQIEFHIMRRLMGQAVLLASAGVLINVLLIAATAIGTFGYADWGWEEAMVLGAMFGATDPVATVTLLKELGAPETLSVLIESESLLNDGTGFVLFSVFFDQLKGAASYSLGEIFAKVFVSALGGAVIGVLLGLTGLWVLLQSWEDDLLAVTSTVVVVWGTFFACEAFKVSGVVGVVFLGLTFSMYADGYIQRQVLEKLKRYWQTVEYMLNTVLFYFSGLVIVNVMLRTNDGTYVIEGRDWLNLGILYVLLNVIRWVSIVALAPVLKATGYGFSFKSHIVVSYAGLRGAVGLISALLISEVCSCGVGEDAGTDTAGNLTICLTHATQSRMTFLMSGIVLLTLIINGTTTKALVDKLGLNKQSPAAKAFFEKATVQVHEHIDTVVESLKRHPHYKNADWDEVWRHLPVLSRQVYKQRKRMGLAHNRDSITLLKDIDKANTQRFELRKDPSLSEKKQSVSRDFAVSSFTSSADFDLEEPSDIAAVACSEVEQLRVARLKFLGLVKASYRRQYEEGANQSWPSIQILIEAADRCADRPGRPLQEWSGHVGRYVANVSGSSRNCVDAIDSVLEASRNKRLAESYNVASTFVRAHKSVVAQFAHTFDKSGGVLAEDTDGELRQRAPANFPAFTKAVDTVLAENRAMVLEATTYTHAVEHQHPDIARRVKTNITIQRLLKEMEHFAEGMLDKAEIEEADLKLIEAELEQSRKDLSSFRVSRKQTPQQVLHNSAFFVDVDEETIQQVESAGSYVSFKVGDTIWRKGDTADTMMILLRGKVTLTLGPNQIIEKSVGDVLGTMNYVAQGRPRVTTAFCLTNVECLSIPFSLVSEIAAKSKELQYNIHRDAGLAVLDSLYPQFQHASFNLLKSVLPHLRIIKGISDRSGQEDSRMHSSVIVAKRLNHTHDLLEVSKPISFHGGIIIALRGKITQLDSARTSSTVVPFLTSFKPTGPIFLSSDAVLMHVNAYAVKNIEDYIAFETDDFSFENSKTGRKTPKKVPRGAKTPQRSKSSSVDAFDAFEDGNESAASL